MNVLVTGGAGFIGSHIVDALIHTGHDVSVVDDLSGGFAENVDTLYEASCGDEKFMDGLCEKKRFDVLVHCAANARESASQFQPMIVTKRNLMAYMVTLTAAIKHGCTNVVLLSSMSVYGTGEKPPPFDETLRAAPEDIYAVNKAAMERCTEILSNVHAFNYTVIRPHNCMGEKQSLRDKMRNVLAIWMNRIMRGEPIQVYGDGEQTRAFSYIADSLPAFLYAIHDTKNLHGEIINLGGTKSTTINHAADVVRCAMGVPYHPIEHIAGRPLEVKHAFPTYQKSVDLLGYREYVGWKDGVSKMAEWALAQGPQEWMNSDPIELDHPDLPAPWREVM